MSDPPGFGVCPCESVPVRSTSCEDGCCDGSRGSWCPPAAAERVQRGADARVVRKRARVADAGGDAHRSPRKDPPYRFNPVTFKTKRLIGLPSRRADSDTHVHDRSGSTTMAAPLCARQDCASVVSSDSDANGGAVSTAALRRELQHRMQYASAWSSVTSGTTRREPSPEVLERAPRRSSGKPRGSNLAISRSTDSFQEARVSAGYHTTSNPEPPYRHPLATPSHQETAASSRSKHGNNRSLRVQPRCAAR